MLHPGTQNVVSKYSFPLQGTRAPQGKKKKRPTPGLGQEVYKTNLKHLGIYWGRVTGLRSLRGYGGPKRSFEHQSTTAPPQDMFTS